MADDKSDMKAKRRNLSQVMLGDDQFLTTLEASELAGYSQDHIGLLLRRRLIWGQKKGRDWLVSYRSLLEYVQSNPKPGPKTS